MIPLLSKGLIRVFFNTTVQKHQFFGTQFSLWSNSYIITRLLEYAQLGLSIAGPLAGFILLAIWLHQRFDLGIWVLIVGFILGIAGAIDGFRVSMKAMEQMSKDKPGENDPPPVSFNDHN